jgi:hypothetical protein
MIASQLLVTETRPEQTECQSAVKCWKNPSTPLARKKGVRKVKNISVLHILTFSTYRYILIDS